MHRVTMLFIFAFVLVTGCARIDAVGKAPDFTSVRRGDEYQAMMTRPLPVSVEPRRAVDRASLWSGSRASLLGDRRAVQQLSLIHI